MPLDIDWGGSATNPYRILIPRADMPLVQVSPEIRELDVNVFRKNLKDLEASVEGIPWPDTHRHITETTLSGSVYARIVEILPPYLVEFEDGQYSVRTTAANHNILDVKVNNQVSVSVQNSAGLINSPDIQFSSFNGGITVDVTSAYSGTDFPVGTPRRPVNNAADALVIANERGLTSFYIYGSLTLTSGDFRNKRFIGRGPRDTNLTIEPTALVNGSVFNALNLDGTLDGDVFISNCDLTNLAFVDGLVENCNLYGTITLSGSQSALFKNCIDSIAGSATPIIDCGGSGSSVTIAGFKGGITLRNKTGPEAVSINVDPGKVILENTVTNGQIIVRGVGRLEDNSAGATVLATEVTDPETISAQVWDTLLSGHTIPGSAGVMITQAALKAALAAALTAAK